MVICTYVQNSPATELWIMYTWFLVAGNSSFFLYMKTYTRAVLLITEDQVLKSCCKISIYISVFHFPFVIMDPWYWANYAGGD